MEGFEFLALPEKYSSVDIVSYQYFHQLLEKRTIVFNSEISEDIIETFIFPFVNLNRMILTNLLLLF